MSDSSSSSGGGIGFFGLLSIVFIVLKLTHVVSWAWWIVLAPIWAGFAFWLIALAIFTGIAIIFSRR